MVSAKVGLNWGAIFEKTSVRPLTIIGYNDNEAVRISFLHGTSSRMAHLGRHANRQAGLMPKHIPGTENVADLFTKVLTGKRLRWPLRKIFGLDHAIIDKKFGAAVARWTPTRRPTAGEVFAHMAICHHSEIREVGQTVLGGCFCRVHLR